MGFNDTDEKYVQGILNSQICPVLPDKLSIALQKIRRSDLNGLEEIRIRSERPVMLCKGSKDWFLSKDGSLTSTQEGALIADSSDLQMAIQLMSNYSVYSIGEELKQGFLTLPGGHRIGFSGRGVMENGSLKLLKNLSSLNLRIAREVKGCASILASRLTSEGIGSMLIVSPPGYGKTTMLRDMVRIFSNGDKESGIKGFKVGIVDERSEIAGCHLGVPQRDVGVRTDVLDSCRKEIGIGMMVRSMSPEIIAVDEIGSVEDAQAIEHAINSGVFVFATAHGRTILEARRRRGVNTLIQDKLMDYTVVLDRVNGPGEIAEIVKVKGMR